MIPAKFCPLAVIIPAFPDVLLNLKFPAARLLSLTELLSKRSASKVETPTALFRDLTSLNVNLSTLVRTLPFWTPLINIDSSFKNIPFTSIKLKSVTFVPADLTNPDAPLLTPWIWVPSVTEVIAVPTLTFVNVLTSNKRVSNWVLASTKLPDCALKSYSLASPISAPLPPLLLSSNATVAVVPIPKLGEPKILFTNRGSPVL